MTGNCAWKWCRECGIWVHIHILIAIVHLTCVIMKIILCIIAIINNYIGCGRLWITDGIFRVQVISRNAINGYKLLKQTLRSLQINLPDVCAASPEKGKAFCSDNCALLSEMYHLMYTSFFHTVIQKVHNAKYMTL